jgi:uncharacterized protein
MRFAGYAALFDIVDRGGDRISAGAFAATLAKARGGGVPLLWQHDAARPVGVIDQLIEDERGLRVAGRVTASSATAREVAALLRDGTVRGLSFGYRVRGSQAAPPGRGGQPVRLLTALDLIEVSLVTRPMQPGARVFTVQEEK